MIFLLTYEELDNKSSLLYFVRTKCVWQSSDTTVTINAYSYYIN